MLSTVPALLVTLGPGLKERNGWWHFDRSEYTHDPTLMVHLVSGMILTVLLLSPFSFGGVSRRDIFRKRNRTWNN